MGPRVVEAVVRCESVDAVVVLSVLGVANAGDSERLASGDGSYAYFIPWETCFLQKISELMDQTGKPIINVVASRRSMTADGTLIGKLSITKCSTGKMHLATMCRSGATAASTPRINKIYVRTK